MYNDSMEERLKRIEREERSRSRGALMPAFAVLVLIGGGISAISYFSAKQDKANGDVPLPTLLIEKASPSRRDLGLLTRSTNEIAIDVERKITTGGPKNQKAIDRFRKRLDQNHRTGRDLEPKLTREETIVLTAEQHAERSIGEFLKSSLIETTYDHKILEVALAQSKRARELANGEGSSLLGKLPVMELATDAVNMKQNLAKIKAARQNQDLPELNDPAVR